MSLKRLNREIMKVFPDKMRETSLLYELSRFDSEKNSNAIAELSIENHHPTLGRREVLHLSIPAQYPFRPPTIWVPNKIANKRYDRWSTDLTGQIIKSFNKTTDSSAFLAWAFSIIEIPMFASGWRNVPFKLPLNCLCCESITCSGNWTPSFTIADILIEYLARKKFALYCSPLWQKRILPIFNNDRWVLPDDIVFSIIQHLNIPGRLKID
jgi:ubiquitin-protein ligase